MTMPESMTPGFELLDQLVGSVVTTATFCPDHLGLTFGPPGVPLGIYMWPLIRRRSEASTMRHHIDAGYEHEIVALIGQTLTRVDTAEGIMLEFEGDTEVLLPPAAPGGGPELLVYGPDRGGRWFVWNATIPPLDR